MAQTALITGASTGIGYELARIFAARGYHLVVVARDEQKLGALAELVTRQHGTKVAVIPQDLSGPSAAEQVAQALARHGLTVDVLVNNAGIGLYGEFASGDWAAQQQLLQLNIMTLAHLTRLLLPSMIARRQGKILNIASTAGFQPGPLMALYYASKAFVLSFSEAIANELAGSGVTVTALCPGPTTTEFQRRAGVEHTRLMSGRIMDAKRVAQAGFDELMAGKAIVVPGFRNRLLVWLLRLVPRSFAVRVVRAIQEERRPAQGR